MYYGSAGTSLLNEFPCKGKLLAVNREKQERQAHETSVHRKGRKNAWSSVWHIRRTLVGIAYQQTTLCICPVVHVRCEKYRMLDAWMLFL